MSWFKTSEFTTEPELSQNHDCSSIKLKGLNQYRSGEEQALIRSTIGELNSESAVYFMTNGAWSNISIIEYILEFTGPADVYFSTWSISADAIRKFQLWKSSGLVKEVLAVMDIGIRNRKPELYQQAVAAFPGLKFSKCHAKVAIIVGDSLVFTVMGSANLTRNPRREVGIISSSLDIALKNIEWIKEEVGDV